MIGYKLLEIIENQKTLRMSLSDFSWWQEVPTKPGWYFIETNARVSDLELIPPPKGKRHIDIPSKVKASLTLKDFNACIVPDNDSRNFIVYSGETKNLKDRAREHANGSEGTGCLSLSQYHDQLACYEWWFHYAVCDFGAKPNDSKLLRTVGEQLWRAKYGWPILCGK